MYKPFKTVIFRFPLYPIETLAKALSDENSFNALIHESDFRKTIYYTSPELYDELDKYTENKLNAKEQKRVKNTLVKYLSRMSTRCTPFAFFSSCAISTIGSETDICITDHLKAFIRFDMLYLCNLVQQLAKIEPIKSNLQYFVNTTIYNKANKIRYIEYKYNMDRRSYQLIEVSLTPYLKYVLKQANKGINIESLINSLIDKYEVEQESATSYINELIEEQVLVSEIDPIVTGPDFFEYIYSVIERIGRQTNIYPILSKIKDLLTELNLSQGKELRLCKQIENEVAKLNVNYQKKFLLQVDTIRITEQNTLSEKVIETLQDYMTFLNKVTPFFQKETLSNFKQIFINRYEEQEIPLLEALDPELGIGYPPGQMTDINPLLAGLNLPNRPANTNYQYISTPLDSILLRKMLQYNRITDSGIELYDKDIEHLTMNWNNLPVTMSAMFQLIKDNNIPEGFRLQNVTFSGCSAANLLGRFAYCNEDIHQLVTAITIKEQQAYANTIVAEISHTPDSRVGNILARPNLRNYEIVYLANTIRNRQEIIYPSDLMVSVKGNKILLRSKKLNKYIVPRLSTAHNYSNNPTPAYLFLCDLQTQGIRTGLFFDWMELGRQLKFLPRVTYKNIICALATWKIPQEDFIHFTKLNNEKQLIGAIDKWRSQLLLPRYVLLVDNDNKLFIDFESIDSIHAFISTLSNRTLIVLEEYISNNDSFVIDQRDCHYVNECIVPFYREEGFNI